MTVPAVSHVTTLALRAERARTLAETHNAVCRWRRQGCACSTCSDLNDRAARYARMAGELSRRLADVS